MVAIFTSLATTYTRDLSHRVTCRLPETPTTQASIFNCSSYHHPSTGHSLPLGTHSHSFVLTKILGDEVGVQGQFQVQQIKPKTHSMGCPSTTQGCLKLGESDLGHVPSCIYMTYNSVSRILFRHNLNVLACCSESSKFPCPVMHDLGVKSGDTYSIPCHYVRTVLDKLLDLLRIG